MKQSFNLLLMLLCLLIIQACGSSPAVPEKTPEEKRTELYYSHGTSALVKGDYTRALEMLLKAYQISPKDSKVLNNLGMAYYFKGQNKLAIKNITESLQVDPTNTDARTNLGGIYFNMKNYKEARKQYELASRDLVYQHQYRITYNLALLALMEGQRNEARNLLHKSLKEREGYCPALHQLGIMQREDANFKSALENLEEATKGECFKNPASIYELGRTYALMGNNAKAKLKFELLLSHYEKSQYAPLAMAHLKEINDEKSDKVRKNVKREFTDEELEQEMEKYKTPVL